MGPNSCVWSVEGKFLLAHPRYLEADCHQLMHHMMSLDGLCGA